MISKTKIIWIAVLLAGCATPPPIAFQLADSNSKIHQGILFNENQRIEVTVDGQRYQGFYLIASGTAISQPLMGRHFMPIDTTTTFSSNSARAHLVSEDGQQLNCQFLVEARRAVGECQSPNGASFQLFTGTSARND